MSLPTSLKSVVRVAMTPINFLRIFKSSGHLQLADSICRMSSHSTINSRLQYPAITLYSRSYSSSSKCLNASASPAPEGKKDTATDTSPSTSSGDHPETGQVFLHQKYNMYVCWHPEVPFPYEMTKPIDVNAPITDSNLKIQALTPVKEIFRAKHKRMLIQELIKLTYSTKHRFFGLHGKSKRKVLRELDDAAFRQKRLRKYL